MKPNILTSGVDSEYVLGGLCRHLRENGWDVTEIDFGVFRDDPFELLRRFKKEDTVYITSAHTNLTLRVAEAVAQKLPLLYPNYLAPLEVLQVVKPKLSIYIPHDLLTPYGNEYLNEYRYLDLFDFILAPTESPALQAALGDSTKVITAGWIKHAGMKLNKAPAHKQTNGPLRVSLFITMLEHLRCRYGAMGLARYFAPLLKPNVRVKLPAWKGADEVEAALRKLGKAKVIPSQQSSIELILDSDVVISNGASSIHAETMLMGCPAVCLLDDEGIFISEQKSKLRHMPNIYFHDYRNKQPIPDEVLKSIAAKKSNDPVKPFDYGLVEWLIESALPLHTNA